MGYSLPNEIIHGKRLGALSVLQDLDSYSIFQDDNINVDFTTQIKRKDDFISQVLKDLSMKSYLVVGPTSELGQYPKRNRTKGVRKGAIIRSGDIIKFGRVPIMIKESSIDLKKYNKNRSDSINFIAEQSSPN